MPGWDAGASWHDTHLQLQGSLLPAIEYIERNSNALTLVRRGAMTGDIWGFRPRGGRAAPRPACLWPSVSLGLPFVGTYESDDVWSAMGDPTRRAIVASLAERPRAVGELADELPVSRPAVSQHLKVLKNAGLVAERTSGTRRIYRLNPAGVAALRDQLQMFWDRALSGFEDVAEESGAAEGQDGAGAPEVGDREQRKEQS